MGVQGVERFNGAREGETLASLSFLVDDPGSSAGLN